MKIIKNILTIAGIGLLMISCTKKNEKDNSNLLVLKLLTTTSGNTAVLYIEQTDPYTFNGYCLDNFSPTTGAMTADDYFALHAAPVPSMGINQMYKLSKKKCSDLGFASGYTIKETEGIMFDKYLCGPQVTKCDSKAVKEAGFSI